MTKRFERYYLDGLLHTEELLYLDTQTKVLSLTRGGTLIEQVVFYKSYPRQIARSCDLLRFFCSTYPRLLPLHELRHWYREGYGIETREQRGRCVLWEDTSGLRAMLAPFGISLIGYPNHGYSLQAGPRAEAMGADELLVLPLEGVIPTYQRLVLNTKAQVLTLLSGKALVEQVLFYPKEAELFALFAQAHPEPCTYEELLAWQYDVQLTTARRWYERDRGNCAAFSELTGSLKMNLHRLRKRLAGFSMTLLSLRTFGYRLAPLLDKK